MPVIGVGRIAFEDTSDLILDITKRMFHVCVETTKCYALFHCLDQRSRCAGVMIEAPVAASALVKRVA